LGRREKPLDPRAGPVAEFAHDLRELRRQAGSPTYAALARRTYCSKSALSAAANGRNFPSLPVTLAYVRACGGDPDAWAERWRRLDARRRIQAADAAPAAIGGSGPGRPGDPRPPASEEVLEQLAAAVAGQWAAEAEIRGLNHPAPCRSAGASTPPALNRAGDGRSGSRAGRRGSPTCSSGSCPHGWWCSARPVPGRR
jgi:transcriptional regulator with XRE-family HTH domain